VPFGVYPLKQDVKHQPEQLAEAICNAQAPQLPLPKSSSENGKDRDGYLSSFTAGSGINRTRSVFAI
jgi:hypothetical protein